MHIDEARAIVSKLAQYKGEIMKPFRAKVEEFIIVPARQQEFDEMFRKLVKTNMPLKEALEPYKNDVTILVYFDIVPKEGFTRYCNYRYFLFDNEIELDH